MTLTSLPVSELPRLEAWRNRGTVTTVQIPPSSSNDNTSNSITSVDLFYVVSDNFLSGSTKPRLILFHGYPTASFDFCPILADLEEQFEVLCWDYCGYGFSQKVYKTIHEQVDLLEALLQQTNDICGGGSSSQNNNNNKKLKVHILAHDLGDTVVQELLARNQKDETSSSRLAVQSVVMLNGGILPSMHRPTLFQKLLLSPLFGPILQMLANIYLFKLGISKVFGPNTKPTDQEIQELYALVRCNGGDQLLTENIQYMTERVTFQDRWVDALKDYATMENFLLVDGPADPVSGKHLAEAVLEQVPGAKVVLLDKDIGHWPQLEAPKETIKAFYDFHQEIGTFSE